MVISSKKRSKKKLSTTTCNKKYIFVSFTILFAFVYFSDYFEEKNLLKTNPATESKNLGETSISESNSNIDNGISKKNSENTNNEDLIGAIEEVIENVEDQIVTENEKTIKEENEKVDDEKLMEAIEEVIENVEDQIVSENEEAIKEENEKVDDEDLLEAIEEVIENIEDQQRDQEENDSELLEKLLMAKSSIEARVRKDYGKYFDAFFAEEALQEVVGISDTSMERLITLLHSKILSAQLTDEKTTFVWTTGGHSAAAGHGNLFSQSYTAILEDTVKEVFDSLDIEFIGRNHAMGGYNSGPELSCCMNSIYGKDTDVLSWDFGMTDGRDPMNMVLWSHRAALLRDEGLPFMFYMKIPEEIVMNLEERGLGISWRNALSIEKLPDFEKISPETINSIPGAIKYLRCGEHYETQNTICDDMKWNTSVCEHAEFQVSWHPGWKAHMMNGRILGFFVINALVEAMKRLESSKSQIVKGGVSPGISLEYLDHVIQKEITVKDGFLAGSVPDDKYGDTFINHHVPNDTFYHGESICHSGLLPNMARYRNMESNSDEVYSLQDLPPFPDTNTRPSYLVHDSTKEQPCETKMNIDYKDYYLTRHGDGSTYIKLPSGTETGSSEDLYLPERNGLIMICQSRCDWGKCGEGAIQLSTLNSTSTHVELSVNGEQVAGTQRIADFCYFLENSSGELNWGKGKQYELSFLVTESDSYLQISSIIIF